MLKKLFGGIRMTWPKLILFAVISGVVTGLVALLVPDGNSFRQIAVTFEAWILLAILVVVNCDSPVDAACKTFVYFLISQPLVYLVQVPFHSMGFGLFRYYWPYWFIWTVATIPGGFLAWYIKKDNLWAALILSVALAGLVLFGCGYLRSLLHNPPRYLVATLFCFGCVPLLIFGVLHSRTPRIVAACIAVAALIACLVLRGNGNNHAYSITFGLDEAEYPVTEEWTARLEDPENGTVVLRPGEEVVGPGIIVTIYDTDKPAGIILTDPDGNEYFLPASVEKDSNGVPFIVYW